MAHQYEYKILTEYFMDDFSVYHPTRDYSQIQEELEHTFGHFEEYLPQMIQKLPDGAGWEVVSHSVSFLNNHPVATILLRRG
jgi:hypothetical protein